MLSLSELWFILVAVLFIGFFFLEGFDFGVGMATWVVARNDSERRILINSIGPFWDANEVWLLTAGGAMFAAFPHWYATMFSGFYVPLVFVLLALIARGVAFEFRSKLESPRWRKAWDWSILLGSFLPPFLLGVAFSGLLKGLPIDSKMQMNAGLFDMVNVYSVIGGATVVVLCLVHGLLFAALRTVGELQQNARKMAHKLLIPLAVLLVAFASLTYMLTDVFAKRGAILSAIALIGAIAFVLAGYFINEGKDNWAFGMTGTVIALAIASLFVGLFPRVMISSIDEAYSLTVYNAASGSYSLKVMTIVAVSLLPFVLAYQAWSYFVFHKRISEKEHLEY